jgi:hypothetical protein
MPILSRDAAILPRVPPTTTSCDGAVGRRHAHGAPLGEGPLRRVRRKRRRLHHLRAHPTRRWGRATSVRPWQSTPCPAVDSLSSVSLPCRRPAPWRPAPAARGSMASRTYRPRLHGVPHLPPARAPRLPGLFLSQKISSTGSKLGFASDPSCAGMLPLSPAFMGAECEKGYVGGHSGEGMSWFGRGRRDWGVGAPLDLDTAVCSFFPHHAARSTRCTSC